MTPPAAPVHNLILRITVLLMASPICTGHPPGPPVEDPEKQEVGDTWSPVARWGRGSDTGVLGNTHGDIVIDRRGRVYYNTDTSRSIMVHSSGGTLVDVIAREYPGIHGMALVEEDGIEYIYAAHLAGKQVLKLQLDGTLVWSMGAPMASGKYDDNPQAYSPTAVAVAPDGRLYIADGYGRHWVHIFGQDRSWQSSFGGHGTGPGTFRTPHGLAIDTRGGEVRLLVCDRENRRIQRFDLEGNFIDIPVTGLHRPCNLSIRGEEIAVAELEGRVTILDRDFTLIRHLGANPEQSQRAVNGVPASLWIEGIFTAPHGVCFDADGNLYVMDWNATGRISKIARQGQ